MMRCLVRTPQTVAATSLCATRRAYFSSSRPALAVSPFSLFIQKCYGNKKCAAQLSRLAVTKRGKALGKWYRALSADEMAVLRYQAKKMAPYKRKATAVKTKKPKKPLSKMNPYRRFVAKVMRSKQLAHLPPQLRMKAVGKLWKQHK